MPIAGGGSLEFDEFVENTEWFGWFEQVAGDERFGEERAGAIGFTIGDGGNDHEISQFWILLNPFGELDGGVIREGEICDE